MKTVRMTVKRLPNLLVIELYEPDTSQTITRIEADWDAIGTAIAKGGLEHYPIDARVTLFDRDSSAPTVAEKKTELVDAGAIPEDREAGARVRAEILRPFEVDGWRPLEPNQLGDRQRIRRQLPNGLDSYAVDFVRQVPA